MASDADLLARVPGASTISATSRGIALDDAAEWIDDVAYDGLYDQAHVYLAAHLLALRFPADLPGAGTGPIASMSAGEISASYAVAAAAASDSDLSTSPWGRMFLALAKRVSSMGVTGV